MISSSKNYIDNINYRKTVETNFFHLNYLIIDGLYAQSKHSRRVYEIINIGNLYTHLEHSPQKTKEYKKSQNNGQENVEDSQQKQKKEIK